MTSNPPQITSEPLPPVPGAALMSLKDFQAEMERLNRWAQHGCLDGCCQIEPPKGMHTNGGCRCHPKSFAAHLLWLACEIEKHGRRRWPNTDSATNR